MINNKITWAKSKRFQFPNNLLEATRFRGEVINFGEKKIGPTFDQKWL